jgi:hypothetical protein
MKPLLLLRKRAGFRYRYYPNCPASLWLCALLERKSLSKEIIEGLRKHLGLQIDIDITPSKPEEPFPSIS